MSQPVDWRSAALNCVRMAGQRAYPFNYRDSWDECSGVEGGVSFCLIDVWEKHEDDAINALAREGFRAEVFQ